MEQFAAYGHAIASLAIWALIVTALMGLSTRGRNAEDRAVCGKPKRNYDNQWYRSERALMNAVEMSGPFIGATVAAILAGASPFWVNVLAAVFVVSRIATAVVHIWTTNQPMRSLFWAVSFFIVLAMAILALIGVF